MSDNKFSTRVLLPPQNAAREETDEHAPHEPFNPEDHGWTQVEDSGFIGWVGPFWELRVENRLEVAFVAQSKHHNRFGVVQGGMLATLLDRAIGMNVLDLTAGQPQATMQLDIRYLEAVEIGSFVVARCRIEREGRSVIFANATAYVGSLAVASANGIWKIRRSPER